MFSVLEASSTHYHCIYSRFPSDLSKWNHVKIEQHSGGKGLGCHVCLGVHVIGGPVGQNSCRDHGKIISQTFEKATLLDPKSCLYLLTRASDFQVCSPFGIWIQGENVLTKRYIGAQLVSDCLGPHMYWLTFLWLSFLNCKLRGITVSTSCDCDD